MWDIIGSYWFHVVLTAEYPLLPDRRSGPKDMNDHRTVGREFVFANETCDQYRSNLGDRRRNRTRRACSGLHAQGGSSNGDGGRGGGGSASTFG